MHSIRWFEKALRAYAHVSDPARPEGATFARGYLLQAVRRSAGRAPVEWSQALELLPDRPEAARERIVAGFERVFEAWATGKPES
jgi:hypothetical protein